MMKMKMSINQQEKEDNIMRISVKLDQEETIELVLEEETAVVVEVIVVAVVEIEDPSEVALVELEDQDSMMTQI
jgi:hypothetical protein